MKIAVYTIAKNEEKFVELWSKSCQEADYRFILDTGSTDNTLQKIIEDDTIHWAQQEFTPWRFDKARNYALNQIPEDIDICIALDMDEILTPGWRESLEKLMQEKPYVTRPRYKYVWSWNEDGSEGLVYGGDKIHHRHNYFWKHPVHEVISCSGVEIQDWIENFEIHHFPDKTKSRSQYFDLLKLAVEEEPNDDRNQFYLGREYFYHKDIGNSIYHLKKHLDLSKWAPERAASLRMIYQMEKDVSYLYQAFAEDPCRRENLLALSMHYYNLKDWRKCSFFAEACVSIDEKPLDYLCEADAWGYLPWDLLAISSWNMGNKEIAKIAGQKAIEINPNDPRLLNNLIFYTE